MNIFEKRVHVKPYEYPHLLNYVKAIRHSYWTHNEFTFTDDIQDYFVNISDVERNAIKNTMLAISQIEVSVKTFWSKIYDRLPKPEIASLGYTNSECEVRHSDAYSELLELLNLNKEFEKIYEIPAIIDRVGYLDAYLDGSKSKSNKKYTTSVLIFALFIENVSLFSQFLIMMSFKKEKNLLPNIANVVMATSKEEDIHAKCGADIFNIIMKENPKWFNDKLIDKIKNLCLKAYKAEVKVLDWIFENGDLDFLSKYTLYNFIRNRFNQSLDMVGIDPIFDVDEEDLKNTEWFDMMLKGTSEFDFFLQRGTDYSKGNKPITADNIF